MKFDGIILDIDGTIWNTTELVAGAWNKVIDENFPFIKKVNADILKSQFGKTMAEIADNIFGCLTGDEKQILMDKCCYEEHVAISNNTKDIAYDGVIDTIKRISENHKIYIVSNCQKGYVELVIEKNGIESFITDFECYGNTGNGKAANIKLIMDRNGLKNPVYVGDTQGDFDACKACGINFIWAKYGFGKITDDSYYGKIEKFQDLMKIL